MIYAWLKDAFEGFKQAHDAGRLPASLIVAGNAGLGTLSFALECAKYYLCQDEHKAQLGGSCGKCKSCQLFEAASHADFMAALPSTAEESDKDLDLQRDPGFLNNMAQTTQRRSLRIDTIRKLNHYLYESPSYPQGKAAIVYDAQLMVEAAANALLKTFEEPPAGCLIILLTDSFESLLPTILSRALKINAERIDEQAALAFVTEQGASLQRASLALDIARGAPLTASQLIRDNEDLKILEISKRIAGFASSGNPEPAVEALIELGGKKASQILSQMVFEILKYKAGFALEALPLINVPGAQAFLRFQTGALFDSSQYLPYVAGDLPLIPSRAPSALLRTYLNSWLKV